MLNEDLEEYRNTLRDIDHSIKNKLLRLVGFYNQYYDIKSNKSLIDYNKCGVRKRIINHNNSINKLFYHRKQVCISIYDLFERNNLFKCKNYINNIDKYNDTIRIPSKAYTNVITVASELLYDKENNNYVVKFGYAFSNKKDKYNKKIGRELAIERLVNNSYVVIVTDGTMKPTYKQIDESILEYIVEENHEVPTWFINWYMKPNTNRVRK